MSDLDSIVQLNIDVKSPKVTRAGFGIPLILDYHTKYGNYVKTYNSASEMLDDGFVVTDPAYKLATILKGQSRSVPKFKVGRRITPTVQIIKITPTNLTVGFTYKFTMNSVIYSYVVQTADDISDILTGIKTALDLDSSTTITMDTTSLTITATSNKLFTIVIDPITSDYVTIQDLSTVGADLATDLNNIKNEDNDFYCVLSTSQSPADIDYIKSWVESNRKLFLSDITSSDILSSVTNDLASTLKSSAINRTALLYSKNVNEYKTSGWSGQELTRDPGSSTWAYKTISLVVTDKLSASQITYLENKNVNHYTNVANVGITRNGIVSSGEYLDVVIFIDWLYTNIQADIYSLLVSNAKIPFTDDGINLFIGAVSNRLQIGVKAGGIDGNREIIVTAPKVADIEISNKVSRTLPGIKFSCYLAGAIHKTKIEGLISV